MQAITFNLETRDSQHALELQEILQDKGLRHKWAFL